MQFKFHNLLIIVLLILIPAVVFGATKKKGLPPTLPDLEVNQRVFSIIERIRKPQVTSIVMATQQRIANLALLLERNKTEIISEPRVMTELIASVLQLDKEGDKISSVNISAVIVFLSVTDEVRVSAVKELEGLVSGSVPSRTKLPNELLLLLEETRKGLLNIGDYKRPVSLQKNIFNLLPKEPVCQSEAEKVSLQLELPFYPNDPLKKY